MRRISRKQAWGTAACTAVALLAAPAVALADTEDLSAQEISDKAEKELLDAKSVHLELEQKGTDLDDEEPATMELTLDQDDNCVGSLTMADDGGSLELIKQGEKVWMKPDAAFWKAQLPGGQGEAAADIIGDRYLYGTTDDALLKDMAGVCDLKEIQQEVQDESGDESTLKKGDRTKVDGTDVIPVTGRDDGKTTTMYVAAEGTPYLVRATEKGQGTDSTLKLSAYDKPVPKDTPSEEDSVNVSQLQGVQDGGPADNL
ncbi:hypothetical protein OG453_22335 [Streptomyces sp. NBC_01381]|uniref:hypothetical protein n=1 Tax=Streptomyces sp. NBC_01381 TaxID=2903845 RepID=UPI00224EB495|nr:hypothetical protein [Streptomyces sp. NBC_01381]MCX4669381.1 hypothetical protein [Streptomyces sp. NBC_01381]